MKRFAHHQGRALAVRLLARTPGVQAAPASTLAPHFRTTKPSFSLGPATASHTCKFCFSTSSSREQSVKIDSYSHDQQQHGSEGAEGGGFDVEAFKQLGYVQKEKAISETQRAVRELFSEGNYKEALEGAKALEQQCLVHFKDKHPVYASALNNVALMHKHLGSYHEAVQTYLKALQVYKEAFKTEEHGSFATTLVNCGLAFKGMAEEGSSMERMAMKERALESFQRAVEIREKVLDEGHPDLELARNLLALAQAATGHEADAETTLRKSVASLKSSVGAEHSVTATATNNLAYHLATSMPVDEGALTSRQEEALELYGSAHKARLALLGEKHPDTVAVRNNIAELLERMGRTDESLAMRQRILQSLGVSQKDLAEMENVDEKAFNEQKMKTDEKWDEIQAEMIAEQRKQRQKVIKPDPAKLFSTKPKQTSSGRPMRPHANPSNRA
eukprot:TRINITY_DN4076_c0_g1_i1.p1 TRINITY_DN4076_c0_g1~~TRINITY_DN4076_c0_g1_i1.p1  ORF type:complete len:446 (-),score=107.72 TRINITY_DN4076_c0_g1_i1:711-2048(-)